MNVKFYDSASNSFKTKRLEKRGTVHAVIPVEATEEPEYFLSPGWIDLHTHINDGFGLFSVSADRIGWKTGTCLTVDAGSVGDFTIEGFRKYVMPTIKTNFKLFLCISPIGVIFHHEYNVMDYLNVDRTVGVIEENRDIISGVKVRIGSEVIRHEGVEPLRMASEAARKTGLPMMVHIGGIPPCFEDVEPYLEKGDIITHAFNGRGGGVWQEDGTPTKAMQKALEKGVILDVGHGSASFNFAVFEKAYRHPLPKFSMGTDLHSTSVKKAVFNMGTNLTKLYGLGISLEDLMYGVTALPAQILRMDNWCNPDCLRNATLFRIIDRENTYADADGNSRTFHREIVPVAVILNDEFLETESVQ